MSKLFRRLRSLLGVGVTAFRGGTVASSYVKMARHAELRAGDDSDLLGSIDEP